MQNVDIVVLDGASAASLGVTVDVLDAANRIAQRKLFTWRILGLLGTAQARGGVFAKTELLEHARSRDLVVVPGLGAVTEDEIATRISLPDAQVASRWLGRALARGSTIAASCTGVFLLGEAGLLSGRRCTTTWWLIPGLSQLFPDCRPVANCMVTDDDNVWTAGASLAHIDLMLALVARLANTALADEVARRMIVDQRPSQARFVIPSHLAARDPLARKVETYVRGTLRRRISLEEIAEAVAVAPRTLSRRLIDATGMSPMRFVQRIRLDAALHILQTTRIPLDGIAEQVGFAEPSALYRMILRHTGQTPSALRSRAGRAGGTVKSGAGINAVPRRRA